MSTSDRDSERDSTARHYRSVREATVGICRPLAVDDY
jgi:hypothetical protein